MSEHNDAPAVAHDASPEAAAGEDRPLSPQEEIARALQHYSEKVVRVWLTRRNHGRLAQPDGQGIAASDCNDTIEIFLRLRDGRVAEATFESDGCGATFACGSAAAELARGRSVQAVLTVTPEDVLDELDGLPAHNEHCADLAVQALRRAAQDLLTMKNEPWKRLYR